MAGAARGSRSADPGGATPARRTRPLSRDYGGDPRSAELAESIGRHQRVISEHEGAMLARHRRVRPSRGLAGGRCVVHAGLAGRALPCQPRPGPHAGRCCREGQGPPGTLERPLGGAASPSMSSPRSPRSPHPRQTPNWRGRRSTGRRSKPASWRLRSKGASDGEAAAQFQRRFVRFDDERRLIWAQLTGDAYALVKSAILSRARRHDHPSAKDADYVRFESRCADAMLDICIEQGRKKPDGQSPLPRGLPDHHGRPHRP